MNKNWTIGGWSHRRHTVAILYNFMSDSQPSIYCCLLKAKYKQHRQKSYLARKWILILTLYSLNYFAKIDLLLNNCRFHAGCSSVGKFRSQLNFSDSLITNWPTMSCYNDIHNQNLNIHTVNYIHVWFYLCVNLINILNLCWTGSGGDIT